MENVATNQGLGVTETNNTSEETLINTLADDFQYVLKIYKNSDTRERPDCLIFSVPRKIRAANEAAYNPHLIVIGHLSHHEPVLENLELSKQSFLCSFLQRAEKNANLKDFLRLIKYSHEKIQDCYGGIRHRPCPMLSEVTIETLGWGTCNYLSLIGMILMDATFIIELFLRAYFKEARDDYDVIFARTGFIHDIQRDLILVENQLPFFVLTDVYDLAFDGNPNFPPFLHLACHFFSHYYNQNVAIQEVLSPNTVHGKYRSKLEGAKHFTDLIRTFQLPHSFQMHHNDYEESLCIQTQVKHLMDLIRSSLQLSSSDKPKENEPEESLEEGMVQGEYLYSAVLLREAGVKFKVSSSRCLLDIEFDDRSGELRIPPLRVDELTESFYRNLMAWEQHYYPHDAYICSYIFLMEYLIKSVEDVDILVRRRIVINQFGSHDAVVTLFNELCKHVKVEKNHYSSLFRKLNEYNAIRHHSWIAILKLQYFSTLWTGVATIVAVILLVLTLVQTICSIISLLP